MQAIAPQGLPRWQLRMNFTQDICVPGLLQVLQLDVRRVAHRPSEAEIDAVDDAPSLASHPVAAHGLQGGAKVEGICAAGVASHHLDCRPLQGRQSLLPQNSDLLQQQYQRGGVDAEGWRNIIWIAGCCRTATQLTSRSSTCFSSFACRLSSLWFGQQECRHDAALSAKASAG